MRSKTVYMISLFMVLLIAGCEQEKDFAYDIELLTGNEWGLPRIQETGPASSSFIQSSPNIFYEDGRVSFGGRTDFWRVRDSRSLQIEQRQEIWQVLNLTENELHVEVLTYPNGKFKVNAIFYPLEQ
ncbi:MAG TPA: hypothetical protein VJ876_00710 [Bacteroidales bacterium]|nr:hypothetical protein [Bacteroidales bacterium]